MYFFRDHAMEIFPEVPISHFYRGKNRRTTPLNSLGQKKKNVTIAPPHFFFLILVPQLFFFDFFTKIQEIASRIPGNFRDFPKYHRNSQKFSGIPLFSKKKLNAPHNFFFAQL